MATPCVSVQAILLRPGAVVEISSELLVRNVAAANAQEPGQLLVRPPGGSDWLQLCTCDRQHALAVHLPRSSCMMARDGELHLLGQRLCPRPAPSSAGSRSVETTSGSEAGRLDKRPGGSEQDRAEALASLQRDVAAWEGLCSQRRALAEAADARGESWEQQARAQRLPVSSAGLKLHRRCARAIGKYGCEQGVAIGLEPMLRAMYARRARRGFRTADAYTRWEDVPGLPATPGLRGVATDALSFPLTAALLAEHAGSAPLPFMLTMRLPFSSATLPLNKQVPPHLP
jgi:hypothetical protein